jgi:anti-anti-sigma regulatory factor
MTDSLHINVHSDNEAAVFYLQGRVDIDSSPDLRDQLFLLA